MVFKQKKQVVDAVEEGKNDLENAVSILATGEETEKLESLTNVNMLLQYMTNLDYVKAMITDAKEQSELVEGVAAGGEELSATTEDISNNIQIANQTMLDTIKDTDISLSKINDTFRILEDKINQTNDIKIIMDEVIMETRKIDDVVKVIQTVANQTNLLALNASIEAARSGEHGKGFAVVASEIKKLADSTKREVSLIQNIVEGLNSKIEKASNEIDHMVTAFRSTKTSIIEATGGIQNIKASMDEVGDSFTEVSANVEEQSAATQEMTASLVVINEKSNKLKNEADRTGKAFFDISLKLDEIRLKTLNASKKLDSALMIEITVTDHLMWKWRVYNMILGYVHLEVDKVGDHHVCRLGKWLCTLDRNNLEVAKILSKMEKPHAAVHDCAKRAIHSYNNSNILEAENTLVEIETYSTEVVNLLNELRKVL